MAVPKADQEFVDGIHAYEATHRYAMQLQREVRALRRLLWLHHGHQYLYGDDEEMQCAQCPLDFKRASYEEIEAVFATTSLQAASGGRGSTE